MTKHSKSSERETLLLMPDKITGISAERFSAEFQALNASIIRHGFTPLIQELEPTGARMWALELGAPVQGDCPVEAAKALCRQIRLAVYSSKRPTIEPDFEYERQLKEAGLDHDLDHPMRPAYEAEVDAQGALYCEDRQFADDREAELDHDFERED